MESSLVQKKILISTNHYFRLISPARDHWLAWPAVTVLPSFLFRHRPLVPWTGSPGRMQRVELSLNLPEIRWQAQKESSISPTPIARRSLLSSLAILFLFLKMGSKKKKENWCPQCPLNQSRKSFEMHVSHYLLSLLWLCGAFMQLCGVG